MNLSTACPNFPLAFNPHFKAETIRGWVKQKMKLLWQGKALVTELHPFLLLE